MDKVWMITGAGRGLGRAFTAEAVKNGDKVIAAVRKVPEDALFRNENILPVRMDVTDRAQISSAVEKGVETFGKIDYLINNAGFGMNGAFEEITDEELRTLNEDGSVTYIMTRAQHEEMMTETRAAIEESLAGMSNNEDFPNFTSIDTNADYTEFTVHCTTEELSLTESFSVLGFYMIGGIYNAFNGTPADNIHVVFMNDATGAVISESNSTDMADMG